MKSGLDERRYEDEKMKMINPTSKVKKTHQEGEGADTQDIFKPIHIKYFKNNIIKYVACSYNHAIAVNSKGIAYSWGVNTEYQLGLGYSSKLNFLPTKIQGAIEMKKIVMATCSEKFSALLTDNGEFWTFGSSENGTLGHEEKNSYIISNPKMINDISPMIYITSGPESMMAIDASSRALWVWGNNVSRFLKLNK